MPAALQADVATIRRGFDLMVPPGRIFELRVLNGRGVSSGYFDEQHRNEAVAAAARYAGHAGVYFTFNPVKAALLARAHNRIIEYAKQTTGDADIEQRTTLGIDLDAKRPAGVSSSDAEHNAALARAQEIIVHLRAAAWPEPIVVADSGNGAHVNYRIDLPNDVAARDLIERVLEALDLHFSDSLVQVNLTASNASRIWKVCGTPAVKGDSTPRTATSAISHHQFRRGAPARQSRTARKTCGDGTACRCGREGPWSI